MGGPEGRACKLTSDRTFAAFRADRDPDLPIRSMIHESGSAIGPRSRGSEHLESPDLLALEGGYAPAAIEQLTFVRAPVPTITVRAAAPASDSSRHLSTSLVRRPERHLVAPFVHHRQRTDIK
jgi:hypothetical protein